MCKCFMHVACDANLVSKPSRKRWEEEFYRACAQPILQDVQKYYQNALDLITNDDSQGSLLKDVMGLSQCYFRT